MSSRSSESISGGRALSSLCQGRGRRSLSGCAGPDTTSPILAHPALHQLLMLEVVARCRKRSQPVGRNRVSALLAYTETAQRYPLERVTHLPQLPCGPFTFCTARVHCDISHG